MSVSGGSNEGGETSRRSFALSLTLPELLKETESARVGKHRNVHTIVAERSSNGSVEEFGKFKRPDIPLKKKPKVLEEDKFVEELEKIIQRDFFPDLEKLKAQNAYHNAVENNDIHMLRELYSKYSLGATPRLYDKSTKDTPAKFETPLGKTPSSVASTPTHLPMEERVPRSKDDDDDDAKSTTSTSSSVKRGSMNLNTFLAKYTSEDNQSFQEILENSDKKHKIKYAWLYDKEKEHQDKFSNSSELPSIEAQANYQKQTDLDTWTYKNLNYLMYTPSGAPLTAEEQVQLSKKQPQVFHKNTRFEVVPFKEDFVVGSKASSSNMKRPVIKIGVDGKEIENETPEVNGFSFVRTPSPTPGVEESPFLTWGEIEGTPFRLDGSDTPIPVHSTKPYRMLETTKREKIAMQLSEKVSERYRDRKLKAIEAAKSNLATPRPRSSLDRLSTMSPAARRLVGNKIGSSRDKMLSASYTPKRHVPKVLTPSIRSTSSIAGTPARSLPPTPQRPSADSSSSGAKKRAADFF